MAILWPVEAAQNGSEDDEKANEKTDWTSEKHGDGINRQKD